MIKENARVINQKQLWGMVLAGAALLAAPSGVAAQDEAAPPAADPADVESVDAIIGAVYDVISGPAGEARDWDRMRSLFVPEARLIPTGRRPDGTGGHLVWSIEDYISRAGPQLESGGFFETEIGRTMDRFGNIVQVFSSYESRRTLDDPEPFMRGINSIQLWNDGNRWWVVTIFWESETPDNQIPEKYLNRR